MKFKARAPHVQFVQVLWRIIFFLEGKDLNVWIITGINMFMRRLFECFMCEYKQLCYSSTLTDLRPSRSVWLNHCGSNVRQPQDEPRPHPCVTHETWHMSAQAAVLWNSFTLTDADSSTMALVYLLNQTDSWRLWEQYSWGDRDFYSNMKHLVTLCQRSNT